MKNELSILIIGNFLSETSGVRGVCEDLAEHMMRAGWTVVTSSNKPCRATRLLDMLNTVWTQRNSYKLASIDIFSGLSFYWAEVVGFLLRKLRKPYVLSLRGGNLPGFAKCNPERVTRLFKSAAAVTAPSRYLLEQMKPYCPEIIIIPNPIDIERYPFKIRSVPHPTLMWLRAFHDIYNAQMAIYVAASLVPQYPQFRLMMGGADKGDGSFQKAKQLADAVGVSDAIEFAGKIPKTEVPAWLQKGEIFINTTNVDNTPVTVIEAMACGLPIVSTNVGGIPYLLDDEKDALLVPPNDLESMAAAVRRLLTEPGLSACLSGNARKKVEQFDWSEVLPQWEKLFCGIIGC